jgi:hypothetical protein
MLLNRVSEQTRDLSITSKDVQVPIAELSPFNGSIPFMTATIGEKDG